MTQKDAYDFATAYVHEVIGKPFPNFKTAIIERAEVSEMANGEYTVDVLAFDKINFILLRYNLINCLNEFNVPIDRERFGLPPKQ